MLLCRTATSDDRAAVAALYRDAGYTGGIAEGDEVLVTEEVGRIVAAVRLCEEHGVVVLRGMFVAADRQRGGVGARLLDAVVEALGERACLCVPFSHLQSFYERIGFRTIEETEAPAFLRERVSRYRESGYEVVVMRRDADPGATGGLG